MKNTTAFLFNKPFLIKKSTIWWNNPNFHVLGLFSLIHTRFDRSGSAQLSAGNCTFSHSSVVIQSVWFLFVKNECGAAVQRSGPDTGGSESDHRLDGGDAPVTASEG